MKNKCTYMEYSSLKKNIDSGNLSSYNVVNLLKGELKKILLEDYVQLKIQMLDVFEKDMVRRYINKFLEKADLNDKTDAAIIKDLQSIKEDIFHNRRITNDFFLSKNIDTIIKNKDKQYIVSALSSLNEQYRDTESIEKKLFLREQAEKCLSCLFDYQQKFRKKKFDYENIIKPLIPLL